VEECSVDAMIDEETSTEFDEECQRRCVALKIIEVKERDGADGEASRRVQLMRSGGGLIQNGSTSRRGSTHLSDHRAFLL
jgi:hypothetical protein